MHHYTLSKSLDFDKVYKSDNQSLLDYIVYGRFANAPLKINLFISNLFLFNYKLKAVRIFISVLNTFYICNILKNRQIDKLLSTPY